MAGLEIRTERPVAVSSPDHIHPWGTANDNSANPGFNRKLAWWLPIKTLRVMDVGCSGGGFVKSILDQGGLAVGIEGSDYSKIRGRAEWATIPGNLFTADATAPFAIVNVDAAGRESQVAFNLITAWEFIEHISEQDLASVFENFKRNLAPGGAIIMSISTRPDIINGVNLHQTVQDEAWWMRKLSELGFRNHPKAVNYFHDVYVRGGTNAEGSFHVVLTRQEDELPYANRLSDLQFLYSQGGFNADMTLSKSLIQAGTFASRPLRVIDIGARFGFEEHWDAYGSQIELIGFEMDPQECMHLNAQPRKFSRSEQYFPVAIDKSIGTKTVYITENVGASSFLLPNLPFIKRFHQGALGNVVGTAQVPTIDLNSFISGQSIPYVDFIKVDVEGAELSVLEGAQNLLSGPLLGVSIEIFFQPYREGQPSFGAIDEYLRRFGFVLFDLKPERWCRSVLASHDPATWYGNGQVIYTQAIYLRDLVQDMNMPDYRFTDDSWLTAMKMVTLAEVFGLPDYAIEVMTVANELNLSAVAPLR